MLIVSHNGKKIINLENIEMIDISDGFSIRIFQVSSPDAFIEIGTYESEAQAKSVLRKIWSSYNNNEKVFLMP